MTKQRWNSEFVKEVMDVVQKVEALDEEIKCLVDPNNDKLIMRHWGGKIRKAVFIGDVKVIGIPDMDLGCMLQVGVVNELIRQREKLATAYKTVVKFPDVPSARLDFILGWEMEAGGPNDG